MILRISSTPGLNLIFFFRGGGGGLSGYSTTGLVEPMGSVHELEMSVLKLNTGHLTGK